MTLADQATVLIPSFPGLRLWEALPWRRREVLPFPFNSTSLRYYYLARNGIYALAQHWNLRNQEVLFPAYFHGVEVEALIAAGVKLRFYPVDANMRVNVEDIVSLLSSSTRAVYLIHYVGFPGPVDELSTICRDRGLHLIEDCALALLSRLGNRPLGSFGDAAVFCLYKTLPIPNGGALWVRDSDAAPWPETTPPSLMSTVAYTAMAVWRHLKFNGGFVHGLLQSTRASVRSMSNTLGIAPVSTNDFDLTKVDLAMSRLCHWVLANQDYGTIVERRRRNYAHLLSRLREVSSPIFDELPPGVCPLFYPLRTKNKAAVLQRLLERGVEAVNLWSRTPRVVPEGAFPEVESLRRTILELPCHQDLDLEAMDWIADQVRELRAIL